MEINMRYKYLDVAKGITLLFVLMAHSCGFPFGLGGYCTAYFMALYFIISGYTRSEYMPKDTELNKSYICRRIKKIVLSYFFYNILIHYLVVFFVGLLYSAGCII